MINQHVYVYSVLSLTGRVETDPAPGALTEPTVRPSLLTRVLRAALPIQLLLLLLLLLTCLLVPACEDEYNCLVRNNMRYSLSPMLHYTDGAPPI